MNRITNLFGIKYPIVQGGMVWCSGWKLACAVSKAGGLGLIGAGSMSTEILKEHIQKAKLNTSNIFGVNLPMMKPQADEMIDVILEEKVPVVFTSAGNPAKYTKRLKDAGVIVTHVIANKKFAMKAVEAGVDAIVAEGFEAGGHNGREETTSMTLIQLIRKCTEIPLIAAGGISTGESMLAAMVLGAEGVQIGSRFAVAMESSAHDQFKKAVFDSSEGSTILTLKKLTPVRMIRNEFCNRITEAEYRGADKEDLLMMLGAGRSKRGIFEGDLQEGELEIGQVSAMLQESETCQEIINDLIYHYNLGLKELNKETSRYKF